jgi:hypothetical protein
VTEEEAKTRWCPFVRLTADGQGEWHVNRDPSLPSSPGDTQAYRCIASACMAWRWLPAPEVQSKLVAIRDYREQHNTDLVTAKNAVEAAWTKPVATDGFCGLAGRP